MQRQFMTILAAAALTICALGKSKDKDRKEESTQTKPALTGIPYALPKTALRVEIQIERLKGVPGRYCKFTPLFFPHLDSNVDCGKPSLMTSIKGFSVTPIGVPDPNRIHSLPVDGSWRISRSDSLTLTEAGTVSGFDSSRQDKTMEIIFGILGNVAWVASKFIGAGDLPDASACSEAKDALTKAVLADEQVCTNYQTMGGTDRSNLLKDSAQLRGAWSSYKRIKALSEKLGNVLGGDGAVGAQTLIPELKAQIEMELDANFLGQEKLTKGNPVYEWIVSDDSQAAMQNQTTEKPDPKPRTSTYKAFTFAPCGIVKETHAPVANPPVKLLCEDANAADSLTFQVVERELKDNVALQIKKQYSPGNGRTFYFVVPSATDLEVEGTCLAGDKPRRCDFAKVPVLVAQWGDEMTLPEPGKDYGVVASLYSASGALQSVKITSKALLDKGLIDDAFKPVNTVIDAKQAADKDAQTRADELTKLQRRQKLAEAAAAIAEKCKNLTPEPSFCKE